MKTKAWYTPKEVADMIGCCEETVRRWLRDGLIRAHKPPGGKGAWRIPFREVEKFKLDLDYYHAQGGR